MKQQRHHAYGEGEFKRQHVVAKSACDRTEVALKKSRVEFRIEFGDELKTAVVINSTRVLITTIKRANEGVKSFSGSDLQIEIEIESMGPNGL